MSDDLIGRADAFLSRYRPAAAAADDVPVLTEVVETPTPAPAEMPAWVEVPTLPEPSASPAGAPGRDLPQAELQALEARVIEAVVQSIHPRLMDDLEHRLRETLKEQLARAADGFAGELRAELEAIVRDAVVHAVEREIARLRHPL